MYDWLSVLHINSEWGSNQIGLDPHDSWTRVGRDFQCVWCSSQWLCVREICVESRSHYAENEKDELCNVIFSLQYVDPRLLSNWKSWQDWGIDSINAKESNSMWCIHSKESRVCLCCGIWYFCNGRVLESDGGESPYFCWLEYIFSYSKWVSESWVDWQGLRNVKEYKEQHVALSSLKSLHWNPKFLPAHGSHVYVIIMHAFKAILHTPITISCLQFIITFPPVLSLPAHIPISHTHCHAIPSSIPPSSCIPIIPIALHTHPHYPFH